MIKCSGCLGSIIDVIIANHPTFGYDAFGYCSSLTEIVIPEGVTSIEERTFEFSTSLTHMHIPASVTSIGSGAFNGCTALEYVCSPDPDGAAAAYCAENDIEFRVCGLTVTVTACAGGSVTADKTEDLMQYEVVTLTAVPLDGYEFVGWAVTDENGDSVEVTGNTFVMPASRVTVTAVFEPTGPAPILGDVDGDGVVSFVDISALYMYLTGISSDFIGENADIDGDGVITYSDVSNLYMYLIGTTTL